MSEETAKGTAGLCYRCRLFIAPDLLDTDKTKFQKTNSIIL
jgi:hypothetical protein